MRRCGRHYDTYCGHSRSNLNTGLLLLLYNSRILLTGSYHDLSDNGSRRNGAESHGRAGEAGLLRLHGPGVLR